MKPILRAASCAACLPKGLQPAYPSAVTVAGLVLAAGLAMSEPALAATWYIGPFDGSQPADTADCGAGKGTTAADRPCASLAHWTRSRRQVLADGDTVRIAPGTYSGSGGYHCILLDRSGVTYEGRSAADSALGNYRDVVIDMASAATGTGPCYANGVLMQGQGAGDVTVRNLRIRDAGSTSTSSGTGIKIQPKSPVENVTIDTVWVDNNARQGMLFMYPAYTGSDCGGSRPVRNLTIRNSKASRNRGVFGGVALGCVDTFVIENNVVHDNYGARSYADCEAGASGCNDHDGIQVAGGIHGVIRGNTVYNCGEDCIDIGGHYQQTYDVLVEGNTVFDGGSRTFKGSGGAHHISVRNNLMWNPRMVFETTECNNNFVVENNTFYRSQGSGAALRMWSYCYRCAFRNNIIMSNGSGSTVFVSVASTDENVTWENNLVHNFGSGIAIREDGGDFIGSSARRCNRAGCNCNGQCAQPQWCPLDFAPQFQSDTTLENTQSGLSAFRSQGDTGAWFGPESGDTDVWGRAPEMVDIQNPTAAHLHLTIGDTAARDRGRTLSGFSDDHDGQTRTGAWDIGADEFVAACTTDSNCNDGLSCTQDRCIGATCINTDTCGSGEFCDAASGTCEEEGYGPGTDPPSPPAPTGPRPPRLISVEPIP